ncbi:stress-related protein-like [Pyrus communis]|uniref:stress-related protein-like n=1 Tax=Pyrus communis TaxID=23211 RepID=UPI0035C07028
MAESEASQSTGTVRVDEKNLKYLEFVQVASIYVVVCFSSLYEYAKENSGPLKPGVQTVEGTVRTVTGPVYEKFQDLPFQLLRFVDRKVDESLSEVERHVPILVKQVSSQALSVARAVERGGLVDTAKNLTGSLYAKCEPVVEQVYYKYEPVAEQYAVSAWRALNRLPLFPQVVHIMVPTVSYWSDKYNRVVGYTVNRGYSVAAYLPLIPTERIAKLFDEAENGVAVSTNGGDVVVEQ